MEHRKNGGFRDVDEFIDLLEIKPHFAVQIFELVTVSPMEKPKTGESNVRRRIDF
jgi:hypothetical protein